MHDPPSPSDTSLDWCALLLEQLLKSADALRSGIRRSMQTHGLRDIHFLMLWNCRQNSEGVAQRDLAAALTLSPAQVSGLVEELRIRGLLSAHRPSHDRRRQHWRLTTEGTTLLHCVASELETWARQIRSAAHKSDGNEPLTLLTDLLGIHQTSDRRGDKSPKRGAA